MAEDALFVLHYFGTNPAKALQEWQFTESQRAAIRHIVENAGKEPVPPQLPPNPVTMNDADWVLFGRQMDGRCVFYLEGALVLDESLERSVNETKGSVMREGVPITVRSRPTVAQVPARDWPVEEPLTAEQRAALVTSVVQDAVVQANTYPVAGSMLSLFAGLPPSKLVNADANHARAAKEQARQSGYTGDACTACGGMSVKRTGTCTVCENCGSSGGCG